MRYSSAHHSPKVELFHVPRRLSHDPLPLSVDLQSLKRTAILNKRSVPPAKLFQRVTLKSRSLTIPDALTSRDFPEARLDFKTLENSRLEVRAGSQR
jgi:hypothetical protein